MDNTRKAWIQVPDYTSYEIGEVSRSEIDKLWGSRWAQKCIRDAAEQVAIARFSPLPKKEYHDFCPPQLGFENGDAMIAVSPLLDIRQAILYSAPLQDFTSWTVYVNVKRGRKLFGILPIDYTFEIVVSQEEALELIRVFFDHKAEEVVARSKSWREGIHERYRHRLVGAFFL